jgi:hypothetical protein
VSKNLSEGWFGAPLQERRPSPFKVQQRDGGPNLRPDDPGVAPIRSPSMSAPALASPRRSWRAIRRASALALLVALPSTACRQASSRDASPAPPDAFTPAPRIMAIGPGAGGSAAQATAERSPAYVNAPAPPPAPSPASPQVPGGAQQPVDPVSYLAYAYTMSLELPGDRLTGVMDAHAAACRSAGLRACQLVSSQRSGDPEGSLRGALSLRAEPEWLQRFMQGIPRDVAGASGRVTGQSTTTEDLTREIIDTEATLRAKRGLRDRLQQLLATRPGDLSDLLSVERELARVQGEIDSTESNLAAMRTRVSMSALSIEYASSARAVASSTFEPLRLAVVGFLVAVVESTAALVTVVGGLLPWVIAVWVAVWLALTVRRRRARRRLDAASAAPGQGGGNP